MRHYTRTSALLCAASLGLLGLGLLTPQVARAAAGTGVVTVTRNLDTLLSQGEQQRQQVQRLARELQVAQSTHAQAEQQATQRAQEIERKKGEPDSLARNLRLQALLAQAQAQATQLTQQAAELRNLDSALRTQRQRLLSTTEQILAADSEQRLPTHQRSQWLQVRAAQVDALHGADLPLRTLLPVGVAQDISSSPPAAESPALDDPQALHERADLLRDSADKLSREVARLKARGSELQQRLRLRERAARVDEDLFAEQSTARKSQGRSFAERSTAADTAGTASAPAPGAPPGSVSTTPPAVSSDPAAARAGIDPATLDLLLRSDGAGDPASKLQAITRAQTELTQLSEQLLKRAAKLDQRATELQQKK